MAKKHDFKKFPELGNRQMELLYFESPHKQITESFTAQVVRVHDGDTIRVKWKERNFDFPVRLTDISAPEIQEKGGLEGRRFLSQRILGKEVEIIIDPKKRLDRWGRILGILILAGANINEELVDAGIATKFQAGSSNIISIDDILHDINNDLTSKI